MSTVPSSPSQAAQTRQPDTHEQPETTEKPKQEKHVTAYVVLRALSGDRAGRAPVKSWEVVGEATAASAKAVIEAVVDTIPPEGRAGTYVAVPVRSWQPLPVSIETQTVIKIG